MKKILEILSDEVSRAFKECSYEGGYGTVLVSNRPDLCQFQCNSALSAAKQYKKNPMEIAGDVAAILNKNSAFENVNICAPGFINIDINPELLNSYLKEMAQNERFGAAADNPPKKIIVDYGGANAAKPLHVGHLRSAVIGESFKRMGKYFGNEMIGDIHLGDWGLQMGLIIEELRDRQPQLVYFDENFKGEFPDKAPFDIDELEEIYPAASQKAKENPVFKERAMKSTVKLQNGDRNYMALWKHIMRVSKEDLVKIYKNLNVDFELWKGESDAQPYIEDMCTDLEKRGIAYMSEGALVVDIRQEGDTKELPPCIIKKSDGGALYTTSDLATLIEREALYNPDRYIYVADKRQELHYTQFFRVAKKAGIVKPEHELNFIGFGTMNGADGKPFKTRTGGVMRLEQLIEETENAVRSKIIESRKESDTDNENSDKENFNKENSYKEKSDKGKSALGNSDLINYNIDEDTVRMISLAALKYADLSNQASKDYIFDTDRFTSFKGNTGPYILYTVVRIKSILSKYYESSGTELTYEDFMPAKLEVHKKLELELVQYNSVVENAWKELAPHRICQFMYAVADAFNTFYHDVKILSESDEKLKRSYLATIMLTKDILSEALQLIAVEAPERM